MSLRASNPCAQNSFAFTFKHASWGEYQVEFPAGSQLWVLDRLRLQPDSLVFFFGDATPWDDFIRFHPVQKKASARHSRARAKHHPSVVRALLDECPWLSVDDLYPRAPTCASHRSRVSSSSGIDTADASMDPVPDADGEAALEPPQEHLLPAVEDPAEPPLLGADAADADMPAAAPALAIEDVDVALLLQELADTRQLYAHEDQEKYFYVHFRGGKFLAERKGKSFGYATAFARSSAKDFCRAVRWPQQGIPTQRMGPEAADKIAKEWVRKGHHFCCLWVEAGGAADFVFGAEHAPPEDLEFVDWMLTLDPLGVAWGFAQEARDAWPRGG